MGSAEAFPFASCLKQRTADERSLLGEKNQPLAVDEAVLSKSRSPSFQQLVAARMERVIGRHIKWTETRHQTGPNMAFGTTKSADPVPRESQRKPKEPRR